jgi:hypothetical protein
MIIGFAQCRVGRAAASLVLALLLAAGCAAYERSRVEAKEDMLAAAGFVQRPADSPARLEAMRRLPPHRFVRQVVNGQVTWLYADPTVCGCLYAGGQAAYGRYRDLVLQKRLADERMLAAQMDEAASMNWDWGPWGGVGWWY